MSTVTQSNPFAPFSAKDLQEFEIWMNQDKGRSRFTEEKRAEYCDWVRNPHVKPAPGAEQKRLWNHKYDALSHYRVDGDGKLYRTSTAERDRGRSDRRVICESEIFGTIRDVHVELEHAGVNKVAAAIADRYHGIRKIEVEWLLKRCSTCPAERQNRSRAPLEPVMAAKSPPAERVQIERMIASRPLERVQIDLVDLRHEPDGYYHWILHITDHFSKFTSLFPLMTNISEEVARCMAQWIGMFGHPEIIQGDNGREFKGYLLTLLKHYGIRVTNGRPRTPRIQGLIEQAKETMMSKLQCWKSDVEREGLDSRRWALALPRIALAMNCESHTSLGMRKPYDVFFGRGPGWDNDGDALSRPSERTTPAAMLVDNGADSGRVLRKKRRRA